MSPDNGRRQRPSAARPSRAAKLEPSADDPYEVVYFKRHQDDDDSESMPGREFVESCPVAVRAKIRAVLTQVAAAPPHRFAGGGKWEAMHGEMAGFHEVRVDGPRREHFRVFCRLDTQAQGRGPLLVILAGARKTFRTQLPERVYRDVASLGREYLSRNPRSLG